MDKSPSLSWPVRIYQLARETEWWTWLCDDCLDRWLAKGWQIRVRKLPPPRALLIVGVEQPWGGSAATCNAALDDRTVLTCDDCTRRKNDTNKENDDARNEPIRDSVRGQRQEGGAGLAP